MVPPLLFFSTFKSVTLLFLSYLWSTKSHAKKLPLPFHRASYPVVYSVYSFYTGMTPCVLPSVPHWARNTLHNLFQNLKHLGDFFKDIFLFSFMLMCMFMWMYATWTWMLLEARIGCRIPWIWSYRKLWPLLVAAKNCTQVLQKSNKCP
jgi:hypothetical protein